MKASIENKIGAGIVISLLVLAGIGFLSYSTTHQLVASQNWVAHTYEVMAAVESGRATLTEAETDQRAYLLTGNEKFLQDSKNSQARIGGWMKQMRLLTADNVDQQHQLDRLEPLIQKRLAFLNDRIKLRQE